MATELQYVLLWIVMLLGLWIGMFPLLWSVTKRLPDGGFGVGFPFAAALSAWMTWMLSSLRLMPFSLLSSIFSFVVLLSASTFFVGRHRQEWKQWFFTHRAVVAFELVFFCTSLFFWSFIRAFQPDIQGLEKFMDAGFVNSILRSPWMPPKDMWLAPLSINYYYFGHFISAFLTVLSGIDSSISYNLMLAAIFASVIVGGGSVVYNFLGGGKQSLLAGMLAALLLNFGGNLHTVWHFITRQEKSYWYPDATRFIPFTIHEFPAYSHVVADLHGHVLDLPVVLLFLTLLIGYLFSVVGCQVEVHRLSVNRLKTDRLKTGRPEAENGKQKTDNRLTARIHYPIILGFLLGIMSMTNTWDVPIYGLIFFIVFILSKWKECRKNLNVISRNIIFPLIIVILTALATSLPFHLQFKSFAQGIALVESRSPLWQLGVLWGGFLLISIVAICTLSRRLLPFTLIGVSIFLIMIPEVIYVKDIYIREYHRANTMFKLTYQSFVMFCLVFGMTLGSLLKRKEHGGRSRWIQLIAIIVLLVVFLAHMMYPFFSLKGYYGLAQYHGLYGLNWMAKSYPDDYAILTWMKTHIQGQPVILEAVGESYTDYARFSTFSGFPTVLGWRVHEWLWRGGFDEPQKRTQDVMAMYQDPRSANAQGLFGKYNVQFVLVGALERKSYQVNEEALLSIGDVAFRSGNSYVLALR